MVRPLAFFCLFCLEAFSQGPFNAAKLVPSGDGARALALADFNNDGKKDIAVANTLAKSISILLSDGTGNFQQAPGSPLPMAPGTTNGPLAVAAGDLNRDGKVDIVYAEARLYEIAPNTFNGNSFSVRLGNGDGTFLAPSVIGPNGFNNIARISLVDMDGDNRLDLLVDEDGSNGSGYNGWQYPGDGAGGFIIDLLRRRAGNTAVGDFNKDGRLDYAAASVAGSPSVTIALAVGDGTYTTRSYQVQTSSGFSLNTIYPRHIAVADYDRDGALDLLLLSRSAFGTVLGFRGDGAGAFIYDFVQGTSSNLPSTIAVGDFDGDSSPDWATTGNADTVEVGLIRLPASAVLPEIFSYGSGASPAALAVADFNGDGRDDLAVANSISGNVSLFLTGPPPTRKSQTIQFDLPVNRAVNSPPFLASVSASSGLPVTLTSNTPNVCRTSGTSVTLLAKGDCALTASQSGDESNAPAFPVTQHFSVFGLPQWISVDPVGTRQLAAGPFQLSISSSSGLAITAAAASGFPCSVSGLTVTPLAGGQCLIYFDQNGNDRYSPASTNITFDIQPPPGSAQSIDFPAISDRERSATALSLAAHSSSTLPVSLSSQTPQTCSLFQTSSALGTVTAQLTMIANGTCTVTASVSGTDFLLPASVTRSFNILPPTKQAAALSITSTSARISSTQRTYFPPTSSRSNATRLYTSTTPSICTATNATQITIIAAGICAFSVSQAENDFFFSGGPVSGSVEVINGPIQTQTIIFASLPNYALGTPPITLSAQASVSPVTFSSETPANCSVAGTVLTLTAKGTCSITATQPGNTIWLPAASVTRSFIIGDAASSQAQSISFFNYPSQTVGTPLIVSARASSGLSVTLTSDTPSICAASGLTVSMLAKGQCSLTARQPGDAVFAPAPAVTRTIRVLGELQPQTITFDMPIPNAKLTDPPFAIAATASSGLPVQFSASGSCLVVDNIVTIMFTGRCDLTATQPGNDDFRPTSSPARSFTIGEGNFTGPRVDAVLNGASYALGVLSPSSYAAIFGDRFLPNPKITLRDSASRLYPLDVVFANNTQANVLLPAGIALGNATISVETSAGTSGVGVSIRNVTPGLFSANGSGQGLAAAQALIVNPGGSVQVLTVADGPVPVAPNTEVFLVLYGTGIRGHSTQVSATIGGQSAEVQYAGPQGAFPGLDQINLKVPSNLARRGILDISLTMDGVQTNLVTAEFR